MPASCATGQRATMASPAQPHAGRCRASLRSRVSAPLPSRLSRYASSSLAGGGGRKSYAAEDFAGSGRPDNSEVPGAIITTMVGIALRQRGRAQDVGDLDQLVGVRSLVAIGADRGGDGEQR